MLAADPSAINQVPTDVEQPFYSIGLNGDEKEDPHSFSRCYEQAQMAANRLLCGSCMLW
jgi:hypothetical protein